MKFTLHIKRLAGRCFNQLRQLRSIRRSFNTDAMKTLVNTFIASRVDCCNSVFNGIGAVHLRPIQSVLNASARLIVKKRKYDQITAAIRDELNWLPVQKDLTTNSAISSTNVFIKTQRRRPIYHQCVFVLVRLRVVVIFDQQPVVTWLFCEQTIKRTDHAVLLSLVHLFGIHFR